MSERFYEMVDDYQKMIKNLNKKVNEIWKFEPLSSGIKDLKGFRKNLSAMRDTIDNLISRLDKKIKSKESKK